MVTCVNHEDRPAEWKCGSCGISYCGDCVHKQVRGTTQITSCPKCDGPCFEFRHVEQAVHGRSLAAEIGRSFAYPLRGSGVLTVLLGGLFFGFLDLVAKAALLFGFILSVLVAGYLVLYMIEIISSTAGGKDELPPWPGFSDIVDDILRPLFLALGTLVICFAPAIAYLVFSDRLGKSGVVLLVLLVGGVLYLPMGWLAVAMCGSLLALNPLLVVGSIFRVFWVYLLACLLLVLVFALSLGVDVLMAKADMPIVGTVIGRVLGLYFLAIDMRILGLIYRFKSERLGWFGR